MRTTKQELIGYALKPLSWLYGAVVATRNKLFDAKILKQESFGVPIITVGNITVGGTGKTPHVEYIVRHLCGDYKTAVVSRGYKRKTRGFVLANRHSTPETIGDEAYQIYMKYGDRVKVAVCGKRTYAIKKLLKLFPDLQLIVLDDGFQHRYVHPSISILLTTHDRPYYHDELLPLGRLRESTLAVNRADMIIMTKCPSKITPLDCRLISKEMKLMAFQKLYFSAVEYQQIEPVFPDDNPYEVNLTLFTKRDSVLLLTGIANPRGFINHFNQKDYRIKIAHYPDHHNFSRKDLESLEETFKKMKGERKVIITTEKDAVRLLNNPYFPEELKRITYYVPINIKILQGYNDDHFLSDLRKMIDEG